MLKNGYLPLIIDNKKRKEYIELLLNYNINSSELHQNSNFLVEENEALDAIPEFFTSQYQNAQRLLEEIRK